MIKWVLSVVCFLAVNVGALGREVIPANDGWRFFAGDPDGAELPGYADSEWLEVSVPHDFQISQPWVEPAPDEFLQFVPTPVNLIIRGGTPVLGCIGM